VENGLASGRAVTAALSAEFDVPVIDVHALDFAQLPMSLVRHHRARLSVRSYAPWRRFSCDIIAPACGVRSYSQIAFQYGYWPMQSTNRARNGLATT